MGRNGGGYAFPRELPKSEISPDEALEIIESHSGMTLLDYFASQALSAMQNVHPSNGGMIAKYAYKIGASMLREREKYLDS